MEDQLVQVLANTQLPAEGPRIQAELDLKRAQTNPAFPLSLANIGRHTSVSVEVRQAALSTLRRFIESNWSGENDEGFVISIAEDIKDQIRPLVLDLALNFDGDRKIKTAARYVIIPSVLPIVFVPDTILTASCLAPFSHASPPSRDMLSLAPPVVRVYSFVSSH